MTNERVQIETTNTAHGCLEQGGVCGRVVSYPADLIAQIMEVGADELDTVSGDDLVPHCEGITLRAYLEYHHASQGRVVKQGTIIE